MDRRHPACIMDRRRPRLHALHYTLGMNIDMLHWMNQNHPAGFFCVDLTSSTNLSFEALSMLNVPLLIQANASQLQGLITALIERGFSPGTRCLLPEQNVSATLADLVLKTRPLKLTNLFLVISGE
jgi:hypothetical protein